MVATRSSSRNIHFPFWNFHLEQRNQLIHFLLVAVFHAVELGIGYCNRVNTRSAAILVGGDICFKKDSAKKRHHSWLFH